MKHRRAIGQDCSSASPWLELEGAVVYSDSQGTFEIVFLFLAIAEMCAFLNDQLFWFWRKCNG